MVWNRYFSFLFHMFLVCVVVGFRALFPHAARCRQARRFHGWLDEGGQSIGCHDAAVGGAAWCCVHDRGIEDNGRLILTGEEKVVAERGGATTQVLCHIRSFV